MNLTVHIGPKMVIQLLFLSRAGGGGGGGELQCNK